MNNEKLIELMMQTLNKQMYLTTSNNIIEPGMLERVEVEMGGMPVSAIDNIEIRGKVRFQEREYVDIFFIRLYIDSDKVIEGVNEKPGFLSYREFIATWYSFSFIPFISLFGNEFRLAQADIEAYNKDIPDYVLENQQYWIGQHIRS